MERQALLPFIISHMAVSEFLVGRARTERPPAEAMPEQQQLFGLSWPTPVS